MLEYFITINCILVLGLNTLKYGFWNLCFLCDISLFFTTLVFWIPNRYKSIITSIAALLAFLPAIFWTLDFIFLSYGVSIFGMANYMLNDKYPLFMRFLSTFHIWLWIVHLYLLKKYSYNPNAYQLWLKIIFGVYFSLEFFEPEKPVNINGYENYSYKYILVGIIYLLHRLFFLMF
jgi:hypothetical protein